jgi:23S rRNA (guanosine2251-2'-O)-methyltransferase
MTPPRGGNTSRRRSSPRGLGGDQVEGRQAVRELLIAGRRRVRDVLVAADQDDTTTLQDIVDLAVDNGVPVREVGRNRLLGEARTDAPQGVIAHAAPLREYSLEDLVAEGPGVAPFLVALDGVTDPGNLGAVLRSAECAGATGVILPRHRATHITPAAAKAAAGAIEYLPIAVVGGLPNALDLRP